MALVSERFPVVNQIMMKVRVRRVRDTLILAALVGVLLVIVWLNIRK
jgi:predicted nucleic acid-binding Zn ribbon protein